jgi:hypothetical protein
MPPKEFRVPFSHEVTLYVYFFNAGKVITEYVVKLLLNEKGKEYEVIRFDTAHGGPHKDVLRPDGSKEYVQTFYYLDNNQGLTFALDDVDEHWEFYVERFRKWLQRKETKL